MTETLTLLLSLSKSKRKIITSLILISTHVLTLSTTHERVLLSSPHPKPSFLSNFRSIISTTRSLPPDIRTICFVQFFAWIAWFPILFFTSVWVSDLYTANAVDSARIAGLELGEGLYDEATRAGSRALLFSALIAFATVSHRFFLDQQTAPLIIHSSIESLTRQYFFPWLSKPVTIKRRTSRCRKRKAGGNSFTCRSRVSVCPSSGVSAWECLAS